MRGSILLLPPKILNNSNNNTSDDMAKLHTYIHTCINEGGWMDRWFFWDDKRIDAQSANQFKEQLSSLAFRSEETSKKITQN
jgi:hypothetical protein